jgi:hypothetical protein
MVDLSNHLGKWMIFSGLWLLVLGLIFLLGPKLRLGHLPGDIYIKKGNFTFFAPIGTCLLISLIISLILTLVFKIWSK